MLKLLIAKCCMDCSHIYIHSYHQMTPIKSGPFITDTRKDLIVGCAHRNVCKDFLNEPIQALPAEKLFRINE